jgi:hypothetical protein
MPVKHKHSVHEQIQLSSAYKHPLGSCVFTKWHALNAHTCTG